MHTHHMCLDVHACMHVCVCACVCACVRYPLEASLALQHIGPNLLDHHAIRRDEVKTNLKQDILDRMGMQSQDSLHVPSTSTEPHPLTGPTPTPAAPTSTHPLSPYTLITASILH